MIGLAGLNALAESRAAAPARRNLRIGRAHAVAAPRPLPWPDKAALVIAFVIAAMSMYACAIVLIAGETVTYDRLNHTLAAGTGMAVLASAGPLWLLLRVIDTLAGGPSSRRAVLDHAVLDARSRIAWVVSACVDPPPEQFQTESL